MRHWTVLRRRGLAGRESGLLLVSAAVGVMACATAATQARMEKSSPTQRGGALLGSCQNFSYYNCQFISPDR